MQATAIAHSNIALIKYWGKRNEKKILPANSSLSMTLDRLYTTTTVSFDPGLSKDYFVLNFEEANEKDRGKVSSFLDQVRHLTKTNDYATVVSSNTGPTGAGLASSASGFAALAAASLRALGVSADLTSLSRVARQGSGSACRSVYGGFVEWKKGLRSDGMDSFAQPVASPDHWDLVMVVAYVWTHQKEVSSREGMRRSIATSPFYRAWLESTKTDLVKAKEAILTRDFELLGQITEANALKMHAVTLSTAPPILYWKEATLSLMQTVQELRQSGIPAYFTMDAGPNVVVLCRAPDMHVVRKAISQTKGVQEVIVCHPGPEITYPRREEGI